MNPKIKQLIKEIIMGLMKKEEKHDKNKNCKYEYYSHYESNDSNLSLFESLSNERRIILKTKLDITRIRLLFYLFQVLYDNKYSKSTHNIQDTDNMFMENEGLPLHFDSVMDMEGFNDNMQNNIEEQYTMDENKLYVEYDVNTWMKYIMFYYTMETNENMMDVFGKIIPWRKCHYWHKRALFKSETTQYYGPRIPLVPSQEIYTLEDILMLVD